MTVTSWSAAGADQVGTLYMEEAARWRAAFDWDTAAQWHEVETARTRWNLPGLIVRDASGRPTGWLYYLPTPDGVQLGGVSATDAETTRALVDAFAGRAAGGLVTGFMPDLAPGLDDALTGVGFAVTPHLYLVAPLAATPEGTAHERVLSPNSPVQPPQHAQSARWGPRGCSPSPGCASLGAPRSVPPAPDGGNVGEPGRGRANAVRGWRDGDEVGAADVLRAAYEGSDAVLFAPGGTRDEWRAYLRNLLEQIGCGRFAPEASLVSEVDGVTTGVAVVTRLSRGMAHIAQIAVLRDRQGNGEGSRLLSASMCAAREAGADALSLLVSSRNDAALRFYARHGFTGRGRFLEVRSAQAAVALRAS